MRGEALTHIGGADNPTFTEPVVCTYDQRTQPKSGIDWGEPTPESEAFWAAVKKGRVPEAEAGDQLRAARGRTPDTSERRHGKLGPHADEIVQRYNAGESSTDLARTFGATGATVLALLRREGVTIRARGQRWSPGRGHLSLGHNKTVSKPEVVMADTVQVRGLTRDDLGLPTAVEEVEQTAEDLNPPAELGREPELPADVMAWARLLADTAPDDRPMVQVLRNNVLSALAALDLVVNQEPFEREAAARYASMLGHDKSRAERAKDARELAEGAPVWVVHRRSHVDTAEILRRYREGQSIPEIATALGHSKMTVRRHLLDAGVQLRDDRHTKSGGQNRIHTYPAELVDGVRDLYANGLTQHEVASRLGTTPKIVQTVMRKHGIAPRPAVSRPGRSAGADNTRLARDRLDALGVTSRQVKQWALEHGHIPAIVRGCPPAAVVDLYEAAHPRGDNR